MQIDAAVPAGGPPAPRYLALLASRPGRIAASLVAFALAAPLPALLVALAVRPQPLPAYGWDFRAFYHAADAFLHLRSVYPPPTLAAMATQENFLYPLPAAAAFVPWTLLPLPVATVLFLLGSAGCLVATLRLLGVRDWRCHAAALLSLPAQEAVRLGTIMPALALLLALAWRYRDRRAVAVPVLAALVVAKLFLWPLGVWFLATRRAATAFLAAAAVVAAVVAATLPYGLSLLRHYPALLAVASRFEAGFGYSPLGLALDLGAGRTLALALAVALGLVLLALLVRAGRRGEDERAFRLAIAASLALSPIVWSHYFVLLFVPLALRSPRFSIGWLVLVWVPGSLLGDFGHRALVVAPALAVVALLLGLERPPPRLSALGYALPAAALAVAVAGATAATAERLDRFAALTGPGTASGVAYVRVPQHRRDRLCWQVWTSGLGSGNVRARLATPAGGPVPLHGFRLGADGNAAGCTSVDARTRSLLGELEGRPSGYRLVLAGAGGRPVLSGSLWVPIRGPARR